MTTSTLATFDAQHANYRRDGARVSVDVAFEEQRKVIVVRPAVYIHFTGVVRLDGSVAWHSEGREIPSPIVSLLDRIYYFEERKRL